MKIMFFLLVAALVRGAPSANLWDKWEAHNPDSSITMDHGGFAQFLTTYVVPSADDGPNLVRYADVSPADKAGLGFYVNMLESTKVSDLTRNEQFAFWVNLYNAATVQLILDKYPVSSIRKIKLGRLFAIGPWDSEILEIEGEDVSLNDIEHRILRPIWKDNRIHYAVNCASYGCPNLQPVPFTVENTEELLDIAARAYVNSERGVGLDGDSLYLSSIFDWYQADFGGNESGVIRHLLIYADTDKAEMLRAYDGKIRYRYDWAINE
mgnify:CR=1 FL=1|jgi:hypothetical protein